MTIYEDLLSDISINIIIWRTKNGSDYSCHYSNNKYIQTEQDASMSTYLDNNGRLKEYYNKMLTNGYEQTFIVDNQEIFLARLNENIFYEARCHLPELNDKHILRHINGRIRGPLTNIIGFLTIIHDTRLSKEQQNCLRGIKNSVYDIVSLANDIVDVMNLMSNKVTLDAEIVDIESCIKSAISVVNGYFHNVKINIGYKIDSDIPNQLRLDKKRLEQIIINLITNSFRNTEVGSITILVSLLTDENNSSPFNVEQVQHPEYNLVFRIRDTSYGFKEDDKKCLEALLDIGTNDDNKQYYNYELGIIISKHLCKLMGGNIWFKTDLDIGTTYFFNVVAVRG